MCVWGRGWKNAFRQREIFAFQQANRIYAQNKQIRNSGESKLVGALGHSEQEKWAHVGDDLACAAASEMEEAANIADTRKNMVEGAGPFGPRGSELPINAADMFDELECRSGVIWSIRGASLFISASLSSLQRFRGLMLTDGYKVRLRCDYGVIIWMRIVFAPYVCVISTFTWYNVLRAVWYFISYLGVAFYLYDVFIVQFCWLSDSTLDIPHMYNLSTIRKSHYARDGKYPIRRFERPYIWFGTHIPEGGFRRFAYDRDARRRIVVCHKF